MFMFAMTISLFEYALVKSSLICETEKIDKHKKQLLKTGAYKYDV